MKVTNNNDNLNEFLTKSIKQLRKQECMINEEGQKLLTSVFFFYTFVVIFRTTTFLTYQRTYFAVWGV